MVFNQKSSHIVIFIFKESLYKFNSGKNQIKICSSIRHKMFTFQPLRMWDFKKHARSIPNMDFRWFFWSETMKFQFSCTDFQPDSRLIIFPQQS